MEAHWPCGAILWIYSVSVLKGNFIKKYVLYTWKHTLNKLYFPWYFFLYLFFCIIWSPLPACFLLLCPITVKIIKWKRRKCSLLAYLCHLCVLELSCFVYIFVSVWLVIEVSCGAQQSASVFGDIDWSDIGGQLARGSGGLWQKNLCCLHRRRTRAAPRLKVTLTNILCTNKNVLPA